MDGPIGECISNQNLKTLIFTFAPPLEQCAVDFDFSRVLWKINKWIFCCLKTLFFYKNFFYRLQIYEKDFQRPDICAQWDPENPLCQILGKYKLRLDSQPGVLPR